jgi:hypothetical protein
MVSMVEHLFGRKVMPFQTLNFPVGTEQSAHADCMVFESDPPGYMCGIWVALEDMDMDSGPLFYYPGSHKHISSSAREVEKAIGEPLVEREGLDYQDFHRERYRQFSDYCERVIETHGLEREYATISKGQALIWAANLIHGGSKMNDRSRTRHSQVSHYFFEGCRVYTPLRNEGDHIFWDYPFWVRDPVPEYSTDLVHDTIKEYVPAGAKVLIATTEEDDELLDANGFQAGRFPGWQAEWGPDAHGGERVKELERLRGEGFEYIVFPRQELSALQNWLREFQEHLETRYKGLLRDGYTCAVYALEDRGS